MHDSFSEASTRSPSWPLPSKGPPPGPPPVNPRIAPPPSPVIGVPAVRPSSNGTSGQATFADADATQYVVSHPPEGAIGGVAVARTDFVTAAIARAQFQINTTGIDDARLLCVVTVKGSFIIPTGPLGGTSRRANMFYEVFDGQTGNLLIEAEAL